VTEFLIVGERLALRELTADDVGERYLGWVRDRSVTRYLETRHEAHSLEELAGFVATHSERTDTLLLAIVDRTSAEHVGNVKIGPLHPHYLTADLGIMLGEDVAQSRGLGTEAIRLATELGGSVLGARKLTAGCYSGNIAAGRAFLDAGWQPEGRRVAQFVDDDGVVHDELMFGLVLGDR
jgi:[ribosomal protein S5]-alanine N-acetyltransferase